MSFGAAFSFEMLELIMGLVGSMCVLFGFFVCFFLTIKKRV